MLVLLERVFGVVRRLSLRARRQTLKTIVCRVLLVSDSGHSRVHSFCVSFEALGRGATSLVKSQHSLYRWLFCIDWVGSKILSLNRNPSADKLILMHLLKLADKGLDELIPFFNQRLVCLVKFILLEEVDCLVSLRRKPSNLSLLRVYLLTLSGKNFLQW